MKFAATSALNLPTSCLRNKNYRLRLVNSIVSRSITWIFLTPLRARFLRISQPKPPAPITRASAYSKYVYLNS